jgi:hypothetical protein
MVLYYTGPCAVPDVGVIAAISRLLCRPVPVLFPNEDLASLRTLQNTHHDHWVTKWKRLRAQGPTALRPDILSSFGALVPVSNA